MRSLKFYKLIIVVLVILNLSTLAYFWLSKPPHPPRPGQEPISLKIDLKGDTKTKVDALEKEHHKKKRHLMQKDRNLHKKLFSLVGSEKSPDKILDQIDKNKEEIEIMTFEFFDEISSLCNAQEKKRLLKFVDDRINRIRPGPPPPPRR